MCEYNHHHHISLPVVVVVMAVVVVVVVVVHMVMVVVSRGVTIWQNPTFPQGGSPHTQNSPHKTIHPRPLPLPPPTHPTLILQCLNM